MNSRQCYPHHFMTFEEYGLWTYAREVSHESGVFYFDGPDIAARFSGQSKNTPYRIAHALVSKGFFHTIRKAKRDKKTGIFKATQYRPLSLEEWAAKYLKRYAACEVCEACKAVPEFGNGTIPEIRDGEGESVSKFGNNRP